MTEEDTFLKLKKLPLHDMKLIFNEYWETRKHIMPKTREFYQELSELIINHGWGVEEFNDQLELSFIWIKK